MKLLSGILFFPLLSAVTLLVIPARDARFNQRWTTVTALLQLLAVSIAALVFDRHSSLVQFAETRMWNASLGSHYALGLDGFSLLMVVLTSLLFLLSLVASDALPRQSRNYYLCMLLLDMGLLGVFMARDWALLYVFWELTLVPLFFLIDHWGGRRRHLASLNFVVYTMGGAVFILTALLMIYTHSPVHSTLMDSMEVSAQALDTRQQVVILLLFLVGFGVKLPVFPLHGWLPLAHVEAPASVSILLSGIMLKMGAYGLLRIYAMLPDAVILCQPLLAGLSVFGVLYGALLAWRQSDFKSQIAYGSISHMGWVMLGLTMLTPLSISGAWLQMIAHGLVTAPLFLMAGMLYEKKHSRELASYAGLVKEAPRAATLISLALLMSLGLPSTLGFIAEIRIMMGTWPSLTYGILLPCLATLIAAVYVFRTIGIFFQHGDPHILAAHDAMTDLSSTELAGLLLVLGLSLACGLYPDVLHDYLQASLGAYLATFTLS